MREAKLQPLWKKCKLKLDVYDVNWKTILPRLVTQKNLFM